MSARAAVPGAATRQWLRVLPEVSLALVTLAAVLSLDRLFADRSYVGPVVLAVVASHGIAWLLRERGVNAAVSALVSAGAAVLFCAWVVEPSTTAYGLPGAAFWKAVVDDLDGAWRLFQEVSAPVEPERGFVLASVIAVWATGFVADWAAFRLRASFEALVPTFTMFAFCAALGTGDGRIVASAAYLSAVLFFVLVQSATARSARTAWFASRVAGGPEAIIKSGAVIGVVTMVSALAIGTAFPLADDEPVFQIRNPDRDRDTSRVTVSPLVDVRGRLVTQSDVEVFTVRSEVRAYWRLTALDTFDGAVWGSRGSYKDAGGDLDGELSTDADVSEGVQEFTITALDTPWLPAAYRPERYSGPVGVTFDPDSSSLLAEADTGVGLVYQVRSALPRFDTAELRGAPGESPDDVVDRYTALPPDFPSPVRQLAAAVTESAPTTYDKAIALQRFFRDNFTYSLDVERGHDEQAIVDFLFESRRGYCEQFAGTYAAMARALGIPARVAVGFTPGELREDGLYHVTGRQAHAWPEVFVEDYGWVAFEPTPGRGIPGGEQYTGVPDQQDLSTGPVVLPDSGVATPTTAPGGPSDAPSPAERAEPDSDVVADDLFGETSEGSASPWPRRLLVLGIAVGAVLLLWLAGVPLVRVIRRRRRRARAVTPSARTLVAWEEAGETLSLAGAGRRSWETNDEYARRAVAATAVDAALVDPLAGAATMAAFAPQGVGDDDADAAMALSGQLRTAVHQQVGPVRRLRWVLDPRTLRREP